jgi:hypothetical protein
VFVEDVEPPAFTPACLSQLPRDLEPLGLPAGQGGGGLPQPQVSQSNLLQLPQRGTEFGLVAKPGYCLIDVLSAVSALL